MLLAVGLLFLRCLKRFLLRQANIARADGYDRHSEGLARIQPNTLCQKGKEDFTQSVLNTEVIRQLRFTFASLKRKATDGKGAKTLIKRIKMDYVTIDEDIKDRIILV